MQMRVQDSFTCGELYCHISRHCRLALNDATQQNRALSVAI